MKQNRLLFFFVDDDADDQEIFGMAVSEVEPGAECVYANDGIEALEKLDEPGFVPSGIFIDLNMPRMNGRECLAEIRRIPRFDGIPVFMYSTSADPRLVEDCRKLGAADFIVKPPGLKALTDKLTQVLHDNNLYGRD